MLGPVGNQVIRLSVPGTLQYRDLVLRVVSSSCKLAHGRQSDGDAEARARLEAFDNQVVSAAGEVFNNIAIHGYRGARTGDVEIEIETGPEQMVLRFADTGESFDPSAEAPPDLAGLPESHMGLYIVRSFVDAVSYEPSIGDGQPNRLILTKRF
jgi:serine/threonine-protein kinase RsbW